MHVKYLLAMIFVMLFFFIPAWLLIMVADAHRTSENIGSDNFTDGIHPSLIVQPQNCPYLYYVTGRFTSTLWIVDTNTSPSFSNKERRGKPLLRIAGYPVQLLQIHSLPTLLFSIQKNLYIIDISQPFAPKIVDSLKLPNNIQTIIVHPKNNILYCACSNGHLVTISLSASLKPSITSQLKLPFNWLNTQAPSLIVSNAHTLSYGVQDSAIFNIDLTNPESPSLLH